MEYSTIPDWYRPSWIAYSSAAFWPSPVSRSGAPAPACSKQQCSGLQLCTGVLLQSGRVGSEAVRLRCQCRAERKAASVLPPAPWQCCLLGSASTCCTASNSAPAPPHSCLWLPFCLCFIFSLCCRNLYNNLFYGTVPAASDMCFQDYHFQGNCFDVQCPGYSGTQRYGTSACNNIYVTSEPQPTSLGPSPQHPEKQSPDPGLYSFKP